jgi:hypothetical protein
MPYALKRATACESYVLEQIVAGTRPIEIWKKVCERSEEELPGKERMCLQTIHRISSDKKRPKKWQNAIDWLVAESGVTDFALAGAGGRMVRLQALYEDAVERMEDATGEDYARLSRLALSYLREARFATRPIAESIEKQKDQPALTIVVNAMSPQGNPRLRNALARPTVPGLAPPISIEAPVNVIDTYDGDNGQHRGPG